MGNAELPVAELPVAELPVAELPVAELAALEAQLVAAGSPCRMNTPTTSCPAARSRCAATLLSTPPDIAKTTRATPKTPEKQSNRNQPPPQHQI
jgi:hypothetical protein